MTVADVLDAAMYDRRTLKIKTNARGTIVCMPDGVDEFDTDPKRLGYYVVLSETEADTIFLDEVVQITDDKTGEILITVK